MNVKEDHIHVILSIPLKIGHIRSNWNAKRQDSNKTIQKLSYSQEEALLGKPPLEPGILRKFYRFE